MIFCQTIPVLYSQKKAGKNSKTGCLSNLCENGPEIAEKNTLLHIVSRTKFDPSGVLYAGSSVILVLQLLNRIKISILFFEIIGFKGGAPIYERLR